MPLPKSLARFNRSAKNRVFIRFSGRVPPFAIITHVGRKSGREYRTPLMAFRQPDGFAIALTYGPDTDWMRNVVPAGGCKLEYHRKSYELTNPLVKPFGETQQRFPAPVRLALRLFHTNEVLLLSGAG
jgi:deazaflavin-dependent oxidoreductase (nitroreductase family)